MARTVRTARDSSLLNNNNRLDDVSWFTNISSCIWLSKVTNILEKTIDDKIDSSKCIDILNEQIKIISSYKITDIESYRTIYDDYTNKYLNDSIGAVEQFITDYSDNNISRYFKVKYIGNKRQREQRGYKNPKNIIMDFNSDYFAKTTGRIEDIPLYPTCYCHYFIIVFLLDIIASAEIILPQYSKDNSFYKRFFEMLNENLNSSVLTGLEVFAEYELSYPYCCLYDELRKLTSLYTDKLVFYATPNNKSFEVTIKEYSLITKMFVKYRGAWSDKDIGRIIPNPTSESGKYKIRKQDVIQINSDIEHDKVNGVFSKLRITEGTEPYRMRINITLSGQRIINRIFDSRSDVDDNVKTHKIIDYIPNTASMTAFILWSILNCTVQADNKFKDFAPSNIMILGKYINEVVKTKENKNSRNLVVNTAIPIILSAKTKKEQEAFINSHFSKTQSQQKALIRAEIKRLNCIKSKMNKNNESFTAKLLKDLKHVYSW